MMYSEDWSARAEAYTEAADHLDQTWTDDPRERKQGERVAALLRSEAAKCSDRADEAPSVAMDR